MAPGTGKRIRLEGRATNVPALSGGDDPGLAEQR